MGFDKLLEARLAGGKDHARTLLFIRAHHQNNAEKAVAMYSRGLTVFAPEAVSTFSVLATIARHNRRLAGNSDGVELQGISTVSSCPEGCEHDGHESPEEKRRGQELASLLVNSFLEGDTAQFAQLTSALDDCENDDELGDQLGRVLWIALQAVTSVCYESFKELPAEMLVTMPARWAYLLNMVVFDATKSGGDGEDAPTGQYL